MSNKTKGLIVAIAGVIVALVAALADVIRIGIVPDQFGLVQIVGTVVGVAGLIGGLVVFLREGQD